MVCRITAVPDAENRLFEAVSIFQQGILPVLISQKSCGILNKDFVVKR